MKKELNVAIGKRIRCERERARMTREYLSEQIDVTPRFLADVERGYVGVSVPTLKKICETLHISSDSLLWEKMTQSHIDERLKFVDQEYLSFIDNMVQNQLDLIAYIKNRDDKQ